MGATQEVEATPSYTHELIYAHHSPLVQRLWLVCYYMYIRAKGGSDRGEETNSLRALCRSVPKLKLVVRQQDSQSTHTNTNIQT